MKDANTPTLAAETATVAPKVGRKRFNSLLCEALGSPSKMDWAKADLTMPDHAVGEMAPMGLALDCLEVFTDTLIGPVDLPDDTQL